VRVEINAHKMGFIIAHHCNVIRILFIFAFTGEPAIPTGDFLAGTCYNILDILKTQP
jgi:hypothetical protein